MAPLHMPMLNAESDGLESTISEKNVLPRRNHFHYQLVEEQKDHSRPHYIYLL